MPGRNALPVGGKLAFENAVLAKQGLVEAVANAAEFEIAARRDAGAALEGKRQAEIDKEQQVLVGAGALMEMIEQVENPVTAGDVVVEGRDEAGAGPAGAYAPGLAQDHVIDRRTDHVMGGAGAFLADPGAGKVALVSADSFHRDTAKLVDIRLFIGVTQHMRKVEQRGCRTHQRRHFLAAEAEFPHYRLDGPAAGR